MSRGYFITGTDTGIGKTWTTIALMEELKRQGKQVAGMKPIASGAVLKNGKLVNEDAESIMGSCSRPTEYELINPVVFELPVAPHIAAEQKDQNIDLDKIEASYKQLSFENDVVMVEGVGGWRVPISRNLSLKDLVRKLGLPVIIVVGIRLGCINHAILTAEAIKADGLNLFAWVSNQLEKDYLFTKETIETLKDALPCPHLANLSNIADFNCSEQTKWSNMLLNSRSL